MGLCASWTWVAVSFPMLGKFSTIISSNIFSCPFSLPSPSGTPIMRMLLRLMLSQRSHRLSSFLFFFFFLFFSRVSSNFTLGNLMQKNKTGTELQGQGREVYFQVIVPCNAELSGLLFMGILLQARHRHCQQSPNIYDATLGRPGLGRGGDRMEEPKCRKGQWRSPCPTSPPSQKSAVRCPQYVIILAPFEPSWAAGFTAS